MTGTFGVPRTRGAVSGILLVLLGVWGGLIPFIGPYFNYGYAPDATWHMTTARLLLEVLPAAGTVLGGLLVLGSANRVGGVFGAWLAVLSGAWFVLGVPLSTLWNGAVVGNALGGTTRQVFEYVGLFGGLGVVIVFFAALALGRFAVKGVREADRVAPVVAPEEDTTGTHMRHPIDGRAEG